MAACSSSSDSSSDEASTDSTSSVPAVVTPVIASVLAAPIAVPATDKKIHMAYELVLTNVLQTRTTIRSVKATAGDRTLFEVSGDDLKQRGVTEGRAIGATLKSLQAKWIRAGFPRDPAEIARLIDEAIAMREI